LPILVITKLTTFGNNNKTCQFWIQSKLPVFKPKWKLKPTSKSLECHYKMAGNLCKFWKVACESFLKQLSVPIMARTWNIMTSNDVPKLALYCCQIWQQI